MHKRPAAAAYNADKIGAYQLERWDFFDETQTFFRAFFASLMRCIARFRFCVAPAFLFSPILCSMCPPFCWAQSSKRLLNPRAPARRPNPGSGLLFIWPREAHCVSPALRLRALGPDIPNPIVRLAQVGAAWWPIAEASRRACFQMHMRCQRALSAPGVKT